ncbi:sporulation protein YqfC [Caloramator sp. E03]|uniref:sporulation protein YqfC n=1 Tax=Caloramator sp. E03 TaxID=2576307 RepID=UPI0011105100|nr:sporulation protein YqfC [Caloramator sp. E03]QCX32408.1 sporulation protein YqfC [Caloramator sp. E03]
MQKERVNKLKSRVSESLDIPKDVTMGVPNIKMIGNIEVSIENHKGVIEYSKNILRINSHIGIIKIYGKELEVKEINQEFITVIGNIEIVEFIK